MTGLHGIIFAYIASPGLGELVLNRTSASLPFCGRYRLIDFTLSSMVNAGVHDVGVIMQKDYQSLLDHLGTGKDWDLSRRSGGLRLLPPFGLPDSHFGEYKGEMEALTAMSSYVSGSVQDNFVLCRGDVVGNIDLPAVYESHIKNGAEITAVCSRSTPAGAHHRFVTDDNGISRELLCRRRGEGPGLPSLEIYIITKERLLDFISYCSAGGKLHLHRDAMLNYIEGGGSINVYVHEEFCTHILTVRDYYRASMAMLSADTMAELFPAERPIRTKERSDVSTYYGPDAKSQNCLIADGCYVEGALENCIVFRGVSVAKGAKLKNCVIMQDTTIGAGSDLTYVVCDKNVTVAPETTLAGTAKLPFTIPKKSVI